MAMREREKVEWGVCEREEREGRREGDREKGGREAGGERERERGGCGGGGGGPKTLFYKDCSLGSVKSEQPVLD